MPTVYVLRCEDDCYFIGETQREYYADLDKHFKGEVLGWTQAHKPIRLELLRYFCENQDADMYTRAYMYRYGIDKVRGGSYSDCVLSINQLRDIENLNQMNHIAYGVCQKCGVPGHKIAKCPFPEIIECIQSIRSSQSSRSFELPLSSFDIEMQHVSSDGNGDGESKRDCWKRFFRGLYQTIISLWHQVTHSRHINTNPDLLYSLYSHC